MLLSQKLHALRDSVNELTHFSNKMIENFNEAIKDAELLEKRNIQLSEIEEGIAKFYDEGSESDLGDIGEWIAINQGWL